MQQPHSNRTESTVGAVAEPVAAAAAGAAVAEPAAVVGGVVLALVAVPGHGLHPCMPCSWAAAIILSSYSRHVYS